MSFTMPSMITMPSRSFLETYGKIHYRHQAFPTQAERKEWYSRSRPNYNSTCKQRKACYERQTTSMRGSMYKRGFCLFLYSTNTFCNGGQASQKRDRATLSLSKMARDSSNTWDSRRNVCDRWLLLLLFDQVFFLALHALGGILLAIVTKLPLIFFICWKSAHGGTHRR